MLQGLRIGGASGFWGDASQATPQLLAAGDLDFIVYDYLAEITMAILARARAKPLVRISKRSASLAKSIKTASRAMPSISNRPSRSFIL